MENNILREELIKRIIGDVSLVEMIQILKEVATREVDEQISKMTEVEKLELEKSIFSKSPTN